MKLIDFVSLAYNEQLAQLKRFGTARTSFTIASYHFVLYQLGDFFVELKRRLPDLYLEKMMTMHFEDLPNEYKVLLSPAVS